MTYVREQTPAELRAHMRNLQRMNGWHDPLADRLYQEIQALDKRIAELERDAARYRWLRRQAVAVKRYASGNPNWEVDWVLRGESFEAAVDAAIVSQEMSQGD